MVALGLSVWQVMLAIIIGRLIIAAVAVAVGFIGADWHIGFPVYSRALWGMRGSYIPMVQRIMCGIVGIAVQSYLGGVCITAMLSAIFPSFHRMSNTLPLSANITTKQFIGWVVFNLLSVPFLCARLERKNLVRIFVALNTYSFFTLLAIMIWAVSRAGGGGPLLSQGPLPSSDIGWGICKAITTVIGSIAVGLMSQPDFTRFARTPGAQVTGQWTSILFFGTLMPLFGCITASATQAIYGQPIWNPTEIALRWLETDYTAKTRASGFFVGFGLMACQLVVNTFENGFSTGMDLAAIALNMVGNGCFSGADIGAVCDAAGMICAHEAVQEKLAIDDITLRQEHLTKALANAKPSLSKEQLRFLQTCEGSALRQDSRIKCAYHTGISDWLRGSRRPIA